MNPNNRIAQLETQIRLLQAEVSAMKQQSSVDLILSPEIPKVQAPYVASVQTQSAGYIPFIINGVRYNLLANTV